jgi:hypothetical protein
MTHNPSTRCYGSVWRAHLPEMMFFLLLNGVFGPLFIIYSFWTNRHFPEREPFRSRFLPLMIPYKREYFFWELVIMLKRSSFVISNSFLTSKGASYTAKFFTSICILFSFLWVEILCQPYTTKEFNINSIV